MMKAEDTIMDEQEMLACSLLGKYCFEDVKDTIRETCEHQAKISFKAGIGEVVEPSDELLEIGRKAIEDVLVDWRDNRLSMFNRGNGLVIREKDGRDSNIIRFGPEAALRIGLKAMGQAKLKE